MSSRRRRPLTVGMTETERYLTVIAAICAGLCAGVFFAFSTFVMPALHKLRPGAGITAMQEINRAAPNGLFMTALFGPLVVLAWLVVAFARRSSATTVYIVAGTICFVAGLLVLMTYHVPHNNALDSVDATSAGAPDTWRTYYSGWTAWNHVRTLTFTAATAFFALALRTD
ncbi:MAG: hypothetical protein QOC66_393 [Pseudonocardiales bacterium]|nr:hypothetical protein [Pseudonocardiales bacterium]